MKKILLLALLCVMANCLKAQNVFPLPSGYAGIGISTPTYPLTLNNSTGETGILTINNGTSVYLSHGGWGMSAGKFGIGNGTIPTFVVNSVANGGGSVGNVGIGTSSPLYKLNIAQDVSMNGDVDIAQFGISGSSDDSKRLIFGYDVNGPGFGYIKAGWYQHQWTNLALQPSGGNVGIGITNPSTKFQVNSDIGGSWVAGNFGASTGDRVVVGLLDGVATIGSHNNSLTGWSNLTINRDGGNVSIGTADPKGYKLAVNGSVIATSVTVKLYSAWPDYVFKPNYNLKPLSEVKSYIDLNHHLPEMPSEKEVADKGVDLGEMNKLLTKKVEELTLYLIEKDKEIKEQQERNQIQKSKMSADENLIKQQKIAIEAIEKRLLVLEKKK
jgi:hypothetical protein